MHPKKWEDQENHFKREVEMIHHNSYQSTNWELLNTTRQPENSARQQHYYSPSQVVTSSHFTSTNRAPCKEDQRLPHWPICKTFTSQATITFDHDHAIGTPESTFADVDVSERWKIWISESNHSAFNQQTTTDSAANLSLADYHRRDEWVNNGSRHQTDSTQPQQRLEWEIGNAAEKYRQQRQSQSKHTSKGSRKQEAATSKSELQTMLKQRRCSKPHNTE